MGVEARENVHDAPVVDIVAMILRLVVARGIPENVERSQIDNQHVPPSLFCHNAARTDGGAGGPDPACRYAVMAKVIPTAMGFIET